MSRLSLAILQRVCTGYRVELFRRLAARPELRVRVFIGEDLPNSKVRSATDFGDLEVIRLPTRWLGFRGRVLPVHRGLDAALEEFGPDVILSEGESHLVGFLTASRVRSRKPGRALVHWGLGGLPGDDHEGRLINRLKRPLQSRADAFLAYSSYGAEVLEAIGHPRDSVVVAVNVSDTDRHLRAADQLSETREEARAALGLPDRFTVLAVGALDRNKRIDVLLEAVSGLDNVHALVVGGGPELPALRQALADRGIGNVTLTGPKQPTELPRYYRAADLLVVPGRGGMVISEAMAHSLPVAVHQADGTEYDLVRDGETGLRLASGDAGSFRSVIERLSREPGSATRMGAAGRALIEREANMDAMVERIVEVCQLARSRRVATPSS